MKTNRLQTAHFKTFDVASTLPLNVIKATQHLVNVALTAGDDYAQVLAQLQKAPDLAAYLAPQKRTTA